MGNKYDFSGYVTRNDLLCADGRVIRNGAFKDCDGKQVSLVWNHDHSAPSKILGYVDLENRDDGVYGYGTFNDSPEAKAAKLRVKHGDITGLSIWADQLDEPGGNVQHGNIREVSLCLASANPGAYIDHIAHSADGKASMELYYGENLVVYMDPNEDDESLAHSTDTQETKTIEPDKVKVDDTLAHSDDNSKGDTKDMADTNTTQTADSKRHNPADVIDKLEGQDKQDVLTLIGMALEEDPDDYTDDNDDDNDEGDSEMKHNVFDHEETDNYLSHADEEMIINTAKNSAVGSLQNAIGMYIEENNNHLAHAIESVETLFPDYQNVPSGEPTKITRDQGWVSVVLSKATKSPISRIRTRQQDLRQTDLTAFGYKKGKEKKYLGNIKLLNRTTDPQTVYTRDKLNRDDIVDITDFDVVNSIWDDMKMVLNETVAMAAMVGDGRDDGDESKISEDHIRSIWHDDELYTIHADVDIAGLKTTLNGTNTGANFGENYIYAEAIQQKLLYARENFKGSGTPDFFCTPHLVNVMLLARDLNGRRIYDNVADLARALNVGTIYTCEQFEGLIRTTSDSKKKKLLGICVNLADYRFGSTKGGEITQFNQFDIDFNQEKYLIETRLSGALTKAYSAIALEEDVTTAASGSSSSVG